MVREAALIVHPTMDEGRTFVDERLEERLQDFQDSDIPVYALGQKGYEEENLVGSEFYEDTFSDIQGRGRLGQEALDTVLEYAMIYLGGGKASECVPSAASSLGRYGYTNEDLVADAHSTYDQVDSELMTLQEMRRDQTVDELEAVGSLYDWAKIKSAI